MIKVDVYALLGILQTVAYCSGMASELASITDSAAARSYLLKVSSTLANAADDIRVMFDGIDAGEGVVQ